MHRASRSYCPIDDSLQSVMNPPSQLQQLLTKNVSSPIWTLSVSALPFEIVCMHVHTHNKQCHKMINICSTAWEQNCVLKNDPSMSIGLLMECGGMGCCQHTRRNRNRERPVGRLKNYWDRNGPKIKLLLRKKCSQIIQLLGMYCPRNRRVLFYFEGATQELLEYEI